MVIGQKWRAGPGQHRLELEWCLYVLADSALWTVSLVLVALAMFLRRTSTKQTKKAFWVGLMGVFWILVFGGSNGKWLRNGLGIGLPG